MKKQVVPYHADQNVGGTHPTATVGFPTQAWSVTPQAPGPVCSPILGFMGMAEPSPQQYQETAEYSRLMDIAPNEGALDMSVPERLRRLAERYVNNRDSTVNGVHLESGPSGRFQIVITIDIGDILGDTIN